jgi:hypothetical protein
MKIVSIEAVRWDERLFEDKPARLKS